MTASHIQFIGADNSGAGFATTTPLSVTKTVTLGGLIGVGWVAGFGDPLNSAVTDNLGNVYVKSERVHSGAFTIEFWYAPITTGGSLTTINVAHDSTAGRGIIASEFAGQAAVTGAGAGTFKAASGSPNTITGVTNKTIPANGAAIWATFVFGSATATAGLASGTPSTSTAQSGSISGPGAPNMAIGYAIAGASIVTGFSGTTVFTGANADGAGAGATFNAAIVSRRGNVTITDAARGGVTMSDSL
jgi:hypothetical protein